MAININKFKEVRKISIGVCKKDITTHRTKKKSAFYNCFVLIIRLQMDTIFRQAHVKIFNTGKVEIPGIQNDEFMDKILTKLRRPRLRESRTFSDGMDWMGLLYHGNI